MNLQKSHLFLPTNKVESAKIDGLIYLFNRLKRFAQPFKKFSLPNLSILWL